MKQRKLKRYAQIGIIDMSDEFKVGSQRYGNKKRKGIQQQQQKMNISIDLKKAMRLQNVRPNFTSIVIKEQAEEYTIDVA